MADNTKYAQVQPFALAGGGAIAGATSVVLKSFKTIDGVNLAITDFGAVGFGTIEPGNGTNEEQISFTGVTQNSNGTATLTGVSTVLFLSPYTASSGTAKTHAGSTSFVISNTAGFYDRLTAKADDETITGLWTYPNDDTARARITSDTDTAVATAFVTLGQLSRQAISGASNASTTVKGIVQLPTQAQMDARGVTGSTGALYAVTPNVVRSTLTSDYVIDTGAADAYAIAPTPAITAYATGQVFSFKAVNANTTTSTLAVSGLASPKTIKKLGGTNLAAGDIAAGMIVTVEYDGTNFQMLQPVANAPFPSASVKFGGTGADGALSTSSGTTTIDLGSASVVVKNYTSISITGTASITFTNPAAEGTLVIFKSQGAVTITSSANPTIDLRSLGAAGGASETVGSAGMAFTGKVSGGGGVAASTGAGAGGNALLVALTSICSKIISLGCGAGGGGGGNGNGGGAAAGGAGGRGGGALYIECAGAYNFTTGVMNAAGTVGSVGALGSGAGSGGGGGGGGGGTIIVVYATLTANSGTYTLTAGAGGVGGANTGTGTGGDGAGGGAAIANNGVTGGTNSASQGGAGGAGGAGTSLVVANTEFV